MPSAPHRRDLQHYHIAKPRRLPARSPPTPREQLREPQPWARPVSVEIYRVLDAAVAGMSLLGALWLTGLVSGGSPSRGLVLRLSFWNLLALGAFVTIWHASLAACELYDQQAAPRRPREDGRRLLAATLLPAAVLLGYLLLQYDVRARAGSAFIASAVFWAGAFSLTFAARSAAQLIPVTRARRARKRILMVGSGPRAQRVLKVLRAHPCVYHLIGLVDSDRRGVPPDVRRHTIGGLDDLERVLMRNVVDEVIVALPVRSKYMQIQQAILTCEQMGIDVRYPADVFDWGAAQGGLDSASSPESVALRAFKSDYRQRIKRPVELVMAAVALLLLVPLFLIIAAAIKLQDGGPIFFVQMRHGLRRRVFPMLKFRTMVPGAEAMQAELEPRNEASGPVFKMRVDPRVTRVGAALRRASLDELPQLFNVLAGHMSIVGPRPLPRRDVSQFHDSWPIRRFSVRPGITGLWQVSGRSELTFDEHVALDLRYIDEWSLWLDLKIMFRTVGAVVRRDGAV